MALLVDWPLELLVVSFLNHEQIFCLNCCEFPFNGEVCCKIITDIKLIFYFNNKGYLLSNALNSGSKSGEKVSEQTVTEAATQISTILAETVNVDSTSAIQVENNTILGSTVVIESSVQPELTTSVITTNAVTELQNDSSKVHISRHLFVFFIGSVVFVMA